MNEFARKLEQSFKTNRHTGASARRGPQSQLDGVFNVLNEQEVQQQLRAYGSRRGSLDNSDVRGAFIRSTKEAGRVAGLPKNAAGPMGKEASYRSNIFPEALALDN